MSANNHDSILEEVDQINETITLVKQLEQVESLMKSEFEKQIPPIDKDVNLLRQSLNKNIEELRVISMKKTTDLLKRDLTVILENNPEKIVKQLKTIKNLKEFQNVFMVHYEINEKNKMQKVISDQNLTINNDDPKTFLQFSLESIVRFLQFDLYVLNECFTDGDISAVHVWLTKLYNDPLKDLKSLIDKRLKGKVSNLRYEQLFGVFYYAERFQFLCKKEINNFILKFEEMHNPEKKLAKRNSQNSQDGGNLDDGNVIKAGNLLTDLNSFPLLLQVKELVNVLKNLYESEFEVTNKKFIKLDVKTMGSKGWRMIDEYVQSLNYFLAIETHIEGADAYLMPIRPLFNFLLELKESDLDFSGCLQVIKIEKQIENILRIHKIGKQIPKLFDKIIWLNERTLENAKNKLKKTLNEESIIFDPGQLQQRGSDQIVKELDDFKIMLVKKRQSVLNMMDILKEYDIRDRVINWFKVECGNCFMTYMKNKDESVRKKVIEINQIFENQQF